MPDGIVQHMPRRQNRAVDPGPFSYKASIRVLSFNLEYKLNPAPANLSPEPVQVSDYDALTASYDQWFTKVFCKSFHGVL